MVKPDYSPGVMQLLGVLTGLRQNEDGSTATRWICNMHSPVPLLSIWMPGPPRGYFKGDLDHADFHIFALHANWRF
jgi:hypothetical protein